MPQMTLDRYQLKRTEEKSAPETVDNKLVETLRKILAKGKSNDILHNEGFPPHTLVGHVILALTRCVELERFISSLGSIKYPSLANPTTRYAFFKNLAKAIIIHDLGKISLDFQKKLYAQEKIPSEPWELLRESRDVKTYGAHELFSLLWSFALLGDNKEDAMIRTTVLLHHYNEFFSQEEPKITKLIEGDNSSELRYLEFLTSNSNQLEPLLIAYLDVIKCELGKVDFIAEAVDELKSSLDFSRLEKLKERMKIFGNDPSKEFPIYNPRDQEEQKTYVDFLVFLGMLRRCDYSSSGNFPIEKMVNLEEVFNDLDIKIVETIEEKLKQVGTTFKGLWQKDLLKKHDSDYLAVIAPTGSGKTELAVLWAKNKGKLIYTLPLRVALNDLYRRLSKEYFDDEHVGLLHSTAFMEYVENALLSTGVDVDEKVNSASLLAMPVMLSTPDQVFLTGLKYYGSDKVVSVYPESAIVVDEVQAYTPEMVAVFLKTLKLIKDAGGKILIITATLPPNIKWCISGFSKDEANKLGVNLEELPNPLFNFKVVDVAEEFKGREQDVKNLAIKRHRIETIDEAMFTYVKGETGKLVLQLTEKALEEIVKRLEEFESKDLKTVMIVVNNVRKAIVLYKLLNQTSEKWEMHLLHSRLPEKRKQETISRIQDVLRKYRKLGVIEKPLLLITTQVVEASVDVDFDAMITEISPIDSQVQRWGRIYRNREQDYPSLIPNVVVFLGVDNGTNNVYGGKLGKDVLERTAEVLRNELNGKLVGYPEERRAIEEVYEGEILKEYIKLIYEIYDKLDYFTLEKKSEAQRVFRQLGGMYFVVPALMREEFGGNEIVKGFRKLLNGDKNFKLSWEEIVREVYQVRGELSRKELNNKKWELKKILQEYSVNVPIWFVLEDSNLQSALHRTFKGYPIVTWDEKKAMDLWEYGVDEVVKRDLDEVDIW
ncbi:CRISPR-associated helicase/endonuclease Cas3 [Palaeococcus ferrophilus]|uniref:CRISPR-associated helicase/endonuclease Cas3 n=1 Tax=Palaeococcus ferrophilus TaxID=83868 RepID=UPI00064F5993|nr:CRISPR-associated helicase/endonuclease Cas3 [Palaeococcus ferrophilus]